MRKLILLAAAATALALPSTASADTACPTPLFQCVEDTVETVFPVVDETVATARETPHEVLELFGPCAGSCVPGCSAGTSGGCVQQWIECGFTCMPDYREYACWKLYGEACGE